MLLNYLKIIKIKVNLNIILRCKDSASFNVQTYVRDCSRLKTLKSKLNNHTRFFKAARFLFIQEKQIVKQLAYLLVKKLIVKKKVLKLIIFDKDKLFILKV